MLRLMDGDDDELVNDEDGNSQIEQSSDMNRPRCYITVEPILLVVLFAQALTGSVQVNLLETVACLQDLKLDISNCSQPLSDSVELLVQPKTAYINSCVSIVQAVIPSILSLFIGPWSDQNGRKPFLIISLTGFILSYSLWGILSSIPGLSLMYFMIPPLVLALSGGMVAINTCSNCYISDISTNKDRAFRLTLVSSVSLFGTVSGYLITARVFSILPQYGYAVVFFTAAFFCFLSLLYTLFLVREIIRKREDRDRNLFNLKFIKEILMCVLEKKEGYSRLLTILLIAVCFFMNYLIQGEASVKFLALKKGLGWTLEDFNTFSAASDTVCVVTSCVGIFLLKKVRVPDLWITIIAATIWCTSDILLSFTTSTKMFWTFSLMGTFAALLGPTVTAEMSKSVPKHNLGKLFAFEATLESLTPFAAPPVYAAIYTAIYVDHPLYIYLVSAGFAILLALLSLVVIILKIFMSKRLVLQGSATSQSKQQYLS